MTKIVLKFTQFKLPLSFSFIPSTNPMAVPLTKKELKEMQTIKMSKTLS